MLELRKEYPGGDLVGERPGRRPVGGRAAIALREIAAEQSGCPCTAEQQCGRHERIDAQVAFAKAKHTHLNAISMKRPDGEIEEAARQRRLAEQRYEHAAERESSEERRRDQ